MMDIKLIRENPDAFKKAVQLKRVNLSVDDLLAADQTLLELKKKNQSLNEEKNANAKKMKGASPEEREAIIKRGREIGLEIDALKEVTEAAEKKLQEYMYLVPMIPDPRAPIGPDDSGNVEVKQWGKKPELNLNPKITLKF